MNKEYRLAVVILHYGDPVMTARLHEQLLVADPRYAGDILVLDNHAPIPYTDAYVRTERNLFWAGGLEYCIQEIVIKGYTHLWFLNNDMLFVSSYPLIHRAWHRLIYYEKKYGRVGIYSPAFTSNPYHLHMVQSSRYGFQQVSYIDGIAPLISMECLRDVGGVDKEDNEIGYGVDIWLSLRATRKGWHVIVDEEVVARHRYHGAARQVEGVMHRAAFLEQRYLSARLGIDYRSKLSEFSTKSVVRS